MNSRWFEEYNGYDDGTDMHNRTPGISTYIHKKCKNCNIIIGKTVTTVTTEKNYISKNEYWNYYKNLLETELYENGYDHNDVEQYIIEECVKEEADKLWYTFTENDKPYKYTFNKKEEWSSEEDKSEFYKPNYNVFRIMSGMSGIGIGIGIGSMCTNCSQTVTVE